tara:strand:- start:2703 stop:2993 length:291 start_codon:yes stop_codon:yes gene_type:complete
MPKPSFSHIQNENKVSTKAELKMPKTKLKVDRTRYRGMPSTISASLERDLGKGFKAVVGSQGGVKSARLQYTKRFKDGGLIETEQKKVRRKYGKGA